MVILILFQWALFALAGYFCALNFYITFFRFRVHRWRGLPSESFKFISGIPILGSLVLYLLVRYTPLPPALYYVGIVLICLDTGGIHWGVANLLYHTGRTVLRKIKQCLS